ncbi:MAG: hypothetical protein F4X76_11375, partial [Chloroflexi bacterium]|nr:hypothetical protein [Chloroflexota bacterium]
SPRGGGGRRRGGCRRRGRVGRGQHGRHRRRNGGGRRRRRVTGQPGAGAETDCQRERQSERRQEPQHARRSARAHDVPSRAATRHACSLPPTLRTNARRRGFPPGGAGGGDGARRDRRSAACSDDVALPQNHNVLGRVTKLGGQYLAGVLAEQWRATQRARRAVHTDRQQRGSILRGRS